MHLRPLAIGLAALLFAAQQGSARAEPIRVALLPIDVYSADAESAYLSGGLAAMISARLERSGRVEVVPVADEAPGGSAAAAQQAARRVGAAYVVYGSFTRFGQGASLDVRCAPVDAGGKTRRVFIQSGSLGEIIPQLDGLTDKLARYLGAPAERSRAAEAGAEPAPESELVELRRRVEALERQVYQGAPDSPAQVDAGTPLE